MTGRGAGASGFSLLFLSVDLVGSTRYKQSEPTWPKAFLAFYREFPQTLAVVAHRRSVGLPFRLWKAVGDELLFTCEIDHERDVEAAVRVWMETMQSYERDVLDDGQMATKGGAFIATFPGPDSEVSIPRAPNSEISDRGVIELNDDALRTRRPDDYLYDYLGPSVDTGFRVMGTADSRHFAVSVEVAWALCRAASMGSKDDIPDLLMRSSQELKGVWNGRPYPVLALDRKHDDPVNQAVAKLMPKQTYHDIEGLCRSCAQSDGWPSAIYLPGSDYEPFRAQPEDSLRALRATENEMIGAESLPDPASDAAGDLPPDPPLDGSTI